LDSACTGDGFWRESDEETDVASDEDDDEKLVSDMTLDRLDDLRDLKYFASFLKGFGMEVSEDTIW